MNEFQSETEKLDFLKKYGLAAPTKTSLPAFYYYAPNSSTPVACEIIGCDQAFDNWAVVVINAADTIVKIHSGYLLEMKTRGTPRQKREQQTARKKNATLSTYVVFDIETTGLSYASDKIIEIAAVKHRKEQVTEFHEYVYVPDHIPEKITRLTGITNETLRDASPIDVVLPALYQ